MGRCPKFLAMIARHHDVFLTSLESRPYGTKCISVQPKSGKGRNDKNVEKYIDAHHKLCFIDETKNFMVYLWVPWP